MSPWPVALLDTCFAAHVGSSVLSIAYATIRYISLPPIQPSNYRSVMSKKLSGRNAVVYRSPNPHDLQTKGPSTGRAGRRSYRLLGPETWGCITWEIKFLCDNWCAMRMGRFTYLHMYNYHTADREPAFVCASGVFVEFLRDSNPWTFTQPWSKCRVCFRSRLDTFVQYVSSTQNAITDIMPVRKSRCRLRMTMILEIS